MVLRARAPRRARPVVFAEAVDGAAWSTLWPFLRRAASAVVASSADPWAYGLQAADHGLRLPDDPATHVDAALAACRHHRVQLVVPAAGASLPRWAALREPLRAEGIEVVVSPPDTVALGDDKWRLHRFCLAQGLPTPPTSLAHEHELIKPRRGEGGRGVVRVRPGSGIVVDMAGQLSQAWLTGEEHSVDLLCGLGGEPVYVVPRRRLRVQDGLSVVAQVVRDEAIEAAARRFVAAARCVGPVNLQCFRSGDALWITDFNPRIAGGMSLSMAATENWFRLLPRLLRGERIRPRPLREGLVTLRYLADAFVEASSLRT